MRYDAVLKNLLAGDLASWARLFGIDETQSLSLIDTGFPTVTATVDRLVRVDGEHPWLIHVELQSGYHSSIGLRIVRYSGIIEHELELPVHSILILLSPDADGPAASGTVRRKLPFREIWYDEFHFEVIRIWELPVELFLNGGLGILALAPICNLQGRQLPEVIQVIKKRVDAEVPDAAERNEYWAGIEILMGACYEQSLIRSLLKGIANMRESTTARAYIEEGRFEGELMAVRRVLLKLGTRTLGAPNDAEQKQIESILDVFELENLVERIHDVTSWNELLQAK